MPSYQNVKIKKAIKQYETNGRSRKWMYEILMIGEIKKQTECVKSVRITPDIKMSFGPLWIKKFKSTAGIP